MLEKKSHPDKILVIIGPTSSGKSELAVKLANKFNGEIISCDSRQIYKGMNLGTGKIKGRWIKTRLANEPHWSYIYKGIIHHLIDFVNPKKQYSVALFQKQARKKIQEIIKRGALPILCGGTGHWIDAVVNNQQLPEVKPDYKLRAYLKKRTADKLFHQLLKLDPIRAKSIDRHNKRRLIRALEIIINTGKPVPPISYLSTEALAKEDKLKPKSYSVFWLGINLPQTELFAKIKSRLKQRLKQGMLREIKTLHKQGVSWKRLTNFGLEYKFGALNLQKKISRDEMFNQLLLAIKHYSKRQMTWWKRNKEIVWIKPDAKKAAKLVKKFIRRPLK
ncbi:MAG: tRNA (adenosine(37)-N6)-dimethylallyltransferase MiaA [Candidatus Doudnabacteria bacterium]|nr:tRNA (adenosine(37)-N6)-dimethylallyltransferase MiaA [Candidatus Doudnabacteria bacterium]